MSVVELIGGAVAPGFEPVLAAFRRNFDDHDELGAAFAAYVEGRKVVDVWGGTADARSGAAWTEDTLQLVFSGTKGLTAGCMMLLCERGMLDPELPVTTWWPEFGLHGKGDILLSDVLRHAAGLAALTTDVGFPDLLDPARLADLLAGQPPYWPDGEPLAYHALTYGWLCDALVRRVAAVTVGELFQREIAGPLGLDAWIGLPQRHQARVSRLSQRDYDSPRTGSAYGDRVYANPPFLAEPLIWNEPEFRAAEVPAVSGVASARSMARYYACLAAGGVLDGVRICSPAAVARAIAPRSRGADAFSGDEIAFGLGFELQTDEGMYGPPADAFGHTGAGGSVHGAWPSRRVAFSYCMNEMRSEGDDRRGRRLLAALAECTS